MLLNIQEKGNCSFISMLLIITALTVFRLITLLPDERYIFLGLTLLIILSYAFSNNFKINICMTGYHWYLLIFTAFCYISALWAMDPRYTIGRGNTMLLTTMVLFAISLCFLEARSIDQMLQVIMWSGFVITFCAIFIFGFNQILLAISTSFRIGLNKEFINTNEIGMCAAYSIIITIYFAMYKKQIWYLLFDVPAILVVLATEGKKAILIIGIGFLLLLFFKNSSDRQLLKKLFKNLGLIALVIVALIFLSKLPAFQGINERFEIMFSALLGNDTADYSTVTRIRLIEIGMDLFKKNPIFGIGINNAHFVAGAVFNREDYYLHNNYIELLADGGIVGFTIYYSIFVFLLVKLWKMRDFKDGEYNICFTLLLINLVMDMAAVSFLDRATYFYLMMYCTKYRIMKQQNTKQTDIEK